MIYANACRLNQNIQGIGKCHSAFEHVINLSFEGYPLVSIIEEGFPTQPYGLMVGSNDFKKLKRLIKQEDACLKNGHLFLFGDFHVLETHFYDASLSNQIQASNRSVSILLDRLKSYLKEKGIQNELYARVFESKRTDASIDYGLDKLCHLQFKAEDFAFCLGFGVGLTPSSDDLIVGYFATLQALNQISDDKLVSLHQWIVEKGDQYTNEISLKFIRCILLGYVEEDVASCLNALLNLTHKAFIQSADELLKHGSSSGSDLLCGFYLALQAIQRSQNG